MDWIKKNWSLLALMLFVGLWINQCNKDPEVETIIIEKRVEIPSIEKVYDTIIPDPETVIVKSIDSTVYKKYLKLKDSVQKDSAYKEAIKIREYTESFKDTFQTVEVYSKVRGELLGQSLKYKTEPRTITIRDTIEIKSKRSLSAGAEIGIPTTPNLKASPVVKASLIFKNKKGNTTSISYDTEGRVWVGKTFKIL